MTQCIHSTEDATCIETSVCLCNLNDNKYIDLSPLKTKNYTVANGHSVFYYYPCRDFQLNFTDIGRNSSTGTNECATGASVCVLDSEQNLRNFGLSIEGKFSNERPKTLTFTHSNNVLTILLECSPDLDITYLVASVNDGKHYNLTLFSPYACVIQTKPGLSIGSTLLIICTTIFGVYLIGGVVVLHFLRGARGKEMIPNVDFWTGLPGLVKDGTVFVLTGCNPLVISNADTYDRI
ncbi:hypothetical protein FQR65_LT16228 [Abscondita terminalis]|nr:hypothetical protein FQR65_LT16228 [Abscondita terminalis]